MEEPTPSPEERAAKRALRERMRAIRAGLGEAEREAASVAIAGIVRSSPAWRAARCVGLFASMPGEVDTAALIGAARAEGKRVALPAVIGRFALVFRDATDPATALSPSRFGVLEPTDAADAVALDAIDLFVVPGLAFDPAGYRLGYGGGYYDRTLRGLAAPKVMVAFAAQETEHVPAGAHDVPMDAVVTERGLVVTGRPTR